MDQDKKTTPGTGAEDLSAKDAKATPAKGAEDLSAKDAKATPAKGADDLSAKAKTKEAPETEAEDISAKAKTKEAPKETDNSQEEHKKEAMTKEEKASKKAEKKTKKATEKLQKERARKEKNDLAPGGISKAEEARMKRKATMEKSQKKQEEKAKKRKELTKKQKLVRILVPIAAVILALVLFFLGYFGVYDRHTTAIKLEDGSKISVAEYEYYYRSMYNYYYSNSYQYESYYSSYYGAGAGAALTGFDYTKTPAEQELPDSGSNTDGSDSTQSDFSVDKKYIKGDKATWDDYFCQAAVETAQLYTALYEQATAAGYKMSEDETKEMNDFFDELRETAEKNEYSL
ncbi:MAG TPA: hypothetical protein PLS28_05330, partial [Clostridiales bacterium]|nr:hypothetical protein [Clostridiales bacterium]